jgi:hypothetical protein
VFLLIKLFFLKEKFGYKIETIEVLRGKLPRRVHALVVEWVTFHRAELMENWNRAQQGLPLRSIEPLD